GSLYDEGVPPEMVRRTYDTLTVGRESYVNIPFEYPDRAGNVVHHLYRLKVTPTAAKRGSDLSYYLHRPSRFATARKSVRDAFRGVLLRTSAMVRAWMARPAMVWSGPPCSPSSC